MAIPKHCSICEKETPHSDSEGCIDCKDRKMAEEAMKWMKMTDRDKIADLYVRVSRLEQAIKKGPVLLG